MNLNNIHLEKFGKMKNVTNMKKLTAKIKKNQKKWEKLIHLK